MRLSALLFALLVTAVIGLAVAAWNLNLRVISLETCARDHGWRLVTDDPIPAPPKIANDSVLVSNPRGVPIVLCDAIGNKADYRAQNCFLLDNARLDDVINAWIHSGHGTLRRGPVLVGWSGN